jgi:hypothetical protein
MGGAVRYSLAHPEVFGAAIALSPAVHVPLPPADPSTRDFDAFGNGKEPFVEATYLKLNWPATLKSSAATGPAVRPLVRPRTASRRSSTAATAIELSGNLLAYGNGVGVASVHRGRRRRAQGPEGDRRHPRPRLRGARRVQPRVAGAEPDLGVPRRQRRARLGRVGTDVRRRREVHLPAPRQAAGRADAGGDDGYAGRRPGRRDRN